MDREYWLFWFGFFPVRFGTDRFCCCCCNSRAAAKPGRSEVSEEDSVVTSTPWWSFDNGRFLTTWLDVLLPIGWWWLYDDRKRFGTADDDDERPAVMVVRGWLVGGCWCAAQCAVAITACNRSSRGNITSTIAVAAPAVTTSPLVVVESSWWRPGVERGCTPVFGSVPLSLAACAASSRYNCSLEVPKLFIVVEAAVASVVDCGSSVSCIVVTVWLEGSDDFSNNCCCTYSSMAAACFWSHIICSSATIVPPVGNCVLEDKASTRDDMLVLFMVSSIFSFNFELSIELIDLQLCCKSSRASTPRLDCSWWINVRRCFVLAIIDCNCNASSDCAAPDGSLLLIVSLSSLLPSSSSRFFLVQWFRPLRSRFLNMIKMSTLRNTSSSKCYYRYHSQRRFIFVYLVQVCRWWNEWSQSGDVDGSRIIQSSGHRSVISNAALSRIGNGYRTDLFGDVIGPHDVRTSIFSISSWTTRICSRSGIACEKSRPNNVYQSIIVQRADKSITTMKFVILALTLPLVASFSQVSYISLRFFRTILQFKRSKMRRMLVSHRRRRPLAHRCPKDTADDWCRTKNGSHNHFIILSQRYPKTHHFSSYFQFTLDDTTVTGSGITSWGYQIRGCSSWYGLLTCCCCQCCRRWISTFFGIWFARWWYRHVGRCCLRFRSIQ